MFRLALCSPLLSPFGFKSVTRFSPAPLGVSLSQKPGYGFPARASSFDLLPNRNRGMQGDLALRASAGIDSIGTPPR
jgi:hypothetical protein